MPVKVFFQQDDTPCEYEEGDIVALYDLYTEAMTVRPHMLLSFHFGRRILKMHVSLINAEKTFGDAIKQGYRDTIPPTAA